jgi:hypothetical protein
MAVGISIDVAGQTMFLACEVKGLALLIEDGRRTLWRLLTPKTSNGCRVGAAEMPGAGRPY